MKIAFICPSLEFGRDGVGDYVLRLALELEGKGHQVICISLHDKYLEADPCASEQFRQKNGSTDIYRLSARIPWRRKVSLVKSILTSFNPSWISFHYVGYGYHHYGLPLGLVWLLLLKPIGHWHIMVHEAWLLVTPRLRDQILGLLQSCFLKVFLLLLRPSLLTTSNPLYCRMLQSIGCKSSMQPVFSNIDIHHDCVLNKKPTNQWRFLVFGTVPRDWDLHHFLAKIEEARVANCIEACHFIFAGKLAVEIESLKAALCAYSYPSFSYVFYGELDAKKISCLIQSVHFGVSKTPQSMIEKSSAVAALRLHGLPVVVAVEELNSRFVADCLFERVGIIPLSADFSTELRYPALPKDPTIFGARYAANAFADLLLGLS